MLTILTTTEHLKPVRESIDSVDRLGELVHIALQGPDAPEGDKVVMVTDGKITCPLDWYDTEPPYVFPEVAFSEKDLLALVFYKLGNHQRAFEFLDGEEALHMDMLIATHLQFGYEISNAMLLHIMGHSHNGAIVHHYGNVGERVGAKELKTVYQNAMTHASDDELCVFSAKHYMNFLLDQGDFETVGKVARSLQNRPVSKEAKNAVNVQLASALMAQLSIPYDVKSLIEIRDLQQEGISFYETNGDTVNAGLLLVDAAEIAGFQADYIQAKEYINKAIRYFREADIPEFLGEAMVQRAKLLYSWSKNGSPQYYKPAINAFQDALKVFKRDLYPRKYADIHHNLALIYSEIPVSKEEKPIWTAFCASSFKEVMAFYNKSEYPYEYAMVCHNYATALMQFPEAKLHNNLDKAAQMFTEALQIRTAENYPTERALTLLNQLELDWLLHNEDMGMEKQRLSQMEEKVLEVKALTKDGGLLLKAQEHMDRLEQLKTLL
ncbi:MAG: hypothetical protein AB3N16_07585 [Flavobacteriaceae bacterium]